MRSITLNVVQGIGDIFWIYQKFFPYFDRINFNIMAVGTDRLQQRSLGFIKLLPKVGTACYKIVTSKTYDSIAHKNHFMKPILDNPGSVHDYACNWPLEHGIRLDAIDENLLVAWNLEIYSRFIEIPWKDYQILYVSGSKPDFAWTPSTWSELIIGMRNFGRKEPVILFGASYDVDSLQATGAILESKGISTHMLIGLNPQNAVHVLRNAKYLTGYQSGINILADNFKVPQTMLYFPYLNPMRNTWCQPGHAEKGIFNAFTFDQNVSEVIKSLTTMSNCLSKKENHTEERSKQPCVP